MLQGLYAAASGMEAQQTQLSAVSNDLANLNTSGYQSADVGFENLLYSSGGVSSGSHVATGAGSEASIVGRDTSEGGLEKTGRSLDVAISGEGYIEVRRGDGSVGLTRNGSLQVNAEGQLTDQTGDRLQPPITLPKDADVNNVKIASDGTVSAGGRTVGQIKLVTVAAPNQLLSDGGSQFSPTTASGAVHAASGATLTQGALEDSNVDEAQAMTAMESSQNAYDMDSQALQYQSQMLEIANQLRSGS
jgi:flagellar basal-body rod protein FlgG